MRTAGRGQAGGVQWLAASAGWGRDYPCLQIRTIEQLLAGEWFDYPQANVTLNQAERVQEEGPAQGALL